MAKVFRPKETASREAGKSLPGARKQWAADSTVDVEMRVPPQMKAGPLLSRRSKIATNHGSWPRWRLFPWKINGVVLALSRPQGIPLDEGFCWGTRSTGLLTACWGALDRLGFGVGRCGTGLGISGWEVIPLFGFACWGAVPHPGFWKAGSDSLLLPNNSPLSSSLGWLGLVSL